jgi:hypothetical protein
MPLALTDAQLATVTEAAALLPPNARDGFLRAVAALLGGDQIDDNDLRLAINEALGDEPGLVGAILDDEKTG